MRLFDSDDAPALMVITFIFLSFVVMLVGVYVGAMLGGEYGSVLGAAASLLALSAVTCSLALRLSGK